MFISVLHFFFVCLPIFWSVKRPQTTCTILQSEMPLDCSVCLGSIWLMALVCIWCILALVVGTPTALHKIILPSVEEKNQWFHEITKYVKEQKLVASHVIFLKFDIKMYMHKCCLLGLEKSWYPRPDILHMFNEEQNRI